MNDRHVMKQQIHKLKDEIRALGSVNVNAIEDYKELLERQYVLKRSVQRSFGSGKNAGTDHPGVG